MKKTNEESRGELVPAESGRIAPDVHLQDQTVWLSWVQMADREALPEDQDRGLVEVTARKRLSVIPAQARGSGNPVCMTIEKQFVVYILATKRNGTLYTGVTSDLSKRVWYHKSDAVPGFTGKYGVRQLVYFEVHESAESAIRREKQIKKWNRSWKLQLIEKTNPTWRDLYEDVV